MVYNIYKTEKNYQFKQGIPLLSNKKNKGYEKF